jgi:hypothetical protein
MRAYFPFEALGYKCNPFRALTDEEWSQVALVPPAALAAAQAGHLQILGARGYGKTTLLLGLGAHFRRAGVVAAYEYLAEGQTGFSTQLEGLELFLLDEAQRLSAHERRRLLAALGQAEGRPRLILSTHADLASLFAAPRLPLATYRLEAASEDRLRAVLERRLAFFALPGKPGVSLEAGALRYLHDTFGGDLRAVEHYLYEAFQQLTGPEALTAERLRGLAPG